MAKKRLLKLVPNTGTDLAQLKDASNLSSLLLTALLESLVRERSSTTIKRMLETIRLHRNEAVRRKANKYEITLYDRAFEVVQSLIVVAEDQ